MLGIDEVPCIRLDHLSDDERKAYTLAHNSLCLETDFDEALLFAELEELQQSFDFEHFGLETEKYMKTIDMLQRKELKPITKTHYLICVDVDHHDKVVDYIGTLRNTEGVDIFETCN